MAKVFCPCREPKKLDRSSIPSLIEANECFFPLNSLLYCNECQAIRCPYCITKEPVSWFCSQCLMETTKQGAREASNKCMRNCLRCPSCHANAVIKQVEDGRLAAHCSMCEYKYVMNKVPGRSLASQIRALQSDSFKNMYNSVRQRFPATDSLEASALEKLTLNPTGVNETSADSDAPPLPSNSVPPPLLVPLRAKFRKICRSCGSTLSEPSKHPAQAKFEYKSVARSVLPTIESHKVDSGYKIVLRSFHQRTMNVKIATLDPELPFPSDLKIPPINSEGFSSPLFLVFRESLESRQAFMSGLKSATSGPGWAVSDVNLPPNLANDSVVFFTSTIIDGAPPVGAWMKL